MMSEKHARILGAVDVCRRLKISQQSIAEALGASQSQVSRILSGRSGRWSRLAEDVCLHVERQQGAGVTPDMVCANEDLIAAVQSVWDGSVDHARALATVIRSLAALHGTHQIDVRGHSRAM